MTGGPTRANDTGARLAAAATVAAALLALAPALAVQAELLRPGLQIFGPGSEGAGLFGDVARIDLFNWAVALHGGFAPVAVALLGVWICARLRPIGPAARWAARAGVALGLALALLLAEPFLAALAALATGGGPPRLPLDPLGLMERAAVHLDCDALADAALCPVFFATLALGDGPRAALASSLPAALLLAALLLTALGASTRLSGRAAAPWIVTGGLGVLGAAGLIAALRDNGAYGLHDTYVDVAAAHGPLGGGVAFGLLALLAAHRPARLWRSVPAALALLALFALGRWFEIRLGLDGRPTGYVDYPDAYARAHWRHGLAGVAFAAGAALCLAALAARPPNPR